MKILVPLDFSLDALQALRYAISLGRLLQRQGSDPEAANTELLIYHAFHAPLGQDATFFVDPVLLDKAEREERNKIRQLLATLPELHPIPHRIAARMTLPQEGIPDMVNEESIDLVVMGVRGANEAADWFGSTTLQVMKRSPCPVLAVPRTTQIFHPEQVAFATDLETTKDTSSLNFLKKLLRWWQANLHIIHVHPQPATIGIDQAEEALGLDHIFQGIPHTYHFPEDKDPIRGINRYLQHHPIDLLVIIPRHHVALESLFHTSVMKYLTKHPSIPLLTFHEK